MFDLLQNTEHRCVFINQDLHFLYLIIRKNLIFVQLLRNSEILTLSYVFPLSLSLSLSNILQVGAPYN